MLVRSYGLQVDGNVIRLPKDIGEGFAIAYNLPDGLSVIVSDTIGYDNFSFTGRQLLPSIILFSNSMNLLQKGKIKMILQKQMNSMYIIFVNTLCCLPVH